MTTRRIILATALSLIVLARAAAQVPETPKGLLPVPNYGGGLWNRSYLSGDWGGVRADLANKGIQLDVDWTQYLQGIVDGGRERTSGYGAHLDYLIHLDLARMGLVPGGLVTIRGESRYGRSVNAAGSALPVNTTALFPITTELDDDVPIAITELNYTQYLLPQLAVSAGKVQTLDGDPNEFASGRGKSQFMDANFLFDPVGALRAPYSTLGAGVFWVPSPNLQVKASIFNTVDSSTTTGFDDFGKGLSTGGEVNYQYRLWNLPGGMNVGGLYSFDQEFRQVGGRILFPEIPPNKGSTWALYWSLWQYLWVEDPNDKPINPGDGRPDHQGVGVFMRGGWNDKDTNPIWYSGSIGIGGRGIIPTRDLDTFGVGYYSTRLQSDLILLDLGVEQHSQGFEVFYNLAITPAARLTFDVQVHDLALPDIDTAVVLGMRLNLTF
jgi:porin